MHHFGLLHGGGPACRAREPTLICENPNLVVMLADRLGTACLAVFCVDGHLVLTGDYPTAASQTL